MMRQPIALLLALVVLGSGACFSGGDELGDMMLRPIAGTVEILRGNEIIEVDSDEALEPQDVVVTKADGLARLNLEDERTVMVQARTRVRIRSPQTIEGQKGSVLAMADAGSMKVIFDDITSTVSDGIFRLDRGFGSSRASTYSGSVHLETPGETRLALDPLHQVEVAAGDLPETAAPYEIDVKDEWDRDYLGEVVDLTVQLDLLANGFSNQLGAAPRGLGYFASLVGRDVGFMRPYAAREPADLLVGYTIADNDPDRSLAASFAEALDLHDRGARWGVAAAILDVRTRPLVAQLGDLILGSGVVASGGGGGGDFTFAAADAPAVAPPD
ncbi:MAG: FecR family protein, partial [Actinomycetota bacterium]|nr:FecR family protein [Actinomycetota bacterium]